ncbi:unnamed protein product [Schistosoma curassoni]|uniref:Uncharacterized protein n=1 Tax=Schistosoma curassoni TaxID=6186 RepID=A0A183KH32_9TREM|nr:unnamed protein product [Schistosoma curassoni]
MINIFTTSSMIIITTTTTTTTTATTTVYHDNKAERADRVIIDKHFHIAMDSCLYKDVDDETGVLLADIIQYYTRPNTNEYNIGKYELCGLLTKNSLLIAIYEIGNRTNDAKQLLIEMRDYFDAQGM